MNSVAKATATEALARFAWGLRFEDLPGSVVRKLKESLLDTIGISAFAAMYADSSKSFRAAVRSLGGEGPSTVIGEARGYPSPQAALLNGAYAHTLDFDDTNLVGSLHPGASVIAAALATAEEADTDGRTLLVALAAGYEVTCRVGAALGPTTYDRGFHITAVAGIFGAVAAAAKIRNTKFDAILNAFGLAGSRAAGSMQYLENGAWNKRLHPGFSAHDALIVLAFAEAGVMGAAAPIEGGRGFLNAYSADARPERLTAALGEEWVLLETAIKPYPSCRFAHAAIDLALELREKAPDAGRARASLTLKLPRTAMQIVAGAEENKIRPRNVVEAQFSVYFQVAAAWLDGRYDWGSYDRIGASDVDSLAASIETVLDESIPLAGAELIARVDGTIVRGRAELPLGEPSHPMSWQALEGKFQSMTGPVFGPDRPALLAARLREIDKEPSIASFMSEFRATAT